MLEGKVYESCVESKFVDLTIHCIADGETVRTAGDVGFAAGWTC